jgi:hypothetical protein
VTFDQHKQRIKHQTNIGTLTVNLPIAPTQSDPETLIGMKLRLNGIVSFSIKPATFQASSWTEIRNP